MSFFDGPNPFENQPAPAATGGGGFFDGPSPYAETDTRGFFDLSPGEFAAGNQQAAAASPFGRALTAVGIVGKTLQPFAAPQQLLFGGIGSLEDLMTGQGAQAAWDTLKRGGTSALAYATYQHGGDLPGVFKNKEAERSNPIFGYELFKKVGAPDWLSRWGGTAADFLVDPLLLSAVGKAAKLDGLTAGLRVGENMAASFGSPGALQAFAGGVAAAPFTTQPIKRLVEAVPRGIRQAGRETFVDPLLNARSVPRREFDPVNPTVGQTLIDRYRNVPQPVTDIVERQTAIASQFTVLQNEAVSGFAKASKGLDFGAQKELGVLAGRLADESDPAARVLLEGQIRGLETSTGKAGLYDSTVQAVNKGIQFDVFAAEKLTGAGLMSPEQLAKYQSGDQRHLRRVLAMYGERPEDQIRRVLDRNAPAAITFDNPGLEKLYGLTLNPALPPAPPLTGVKKSELTSTSVGAFPSKTPLLDPVTDASRPVWRSVERELEVGTVDRGSLDLGNMGRAEITSLRNILGWDAVKQVGGKWRVVGGADDSFPVGHPVIQSLFGDLKAQGLADNLRVETRNFKEQVPNYYDPKSGATLEMQRAMADEEIAAAQGALYVHSSDMTAFMAGATPEELAAFENAVERLPMKEQARKGGKNDVTDSWFPVDPADPAMARLVERAKGGGTALFDGANPQPLLGATLPGKVAVTLPTPQEFAAKVQQAYSNPEQHPADFLNSFLREKGMTDGGVARVLEGIGRDYAEKAGLTWRPSDQDSVRAIAAKRAEAGTSEGLKTQSGVQLGGRGAAAVTTARTEISDAYLDVLGEVEDFTTRLTAQGRVVTKAATTNGTVRDIRQYLLDNDLIETLGTADLGKIYHTAGLRVISAEQARALGNGFKEAEVLPAEVHRILLETVSTRKEAPLGLAWQWYSSRWQGIKLANPASIATNIKSGFVMANQVGINPIDLGRGISDYLRLHRMAVKGDGAMDAHAAVNGVNMRELFHHGAFTHNTLLNAEVTQRSNRLMDELANPAGSSLQRNVAAIQNWLTETEQGARTAGIYKTAVTPMRWLGDTYGRVDSVMKGGLYMHHRRQGIKPEQAARMADETFFNYQAVPYVVDGLRRFGLLGMPFASFKFLAAGRFFKNLYQNPYGVDRFYRLPNSSLAAMKDQPGEQEGRSAYDEYEKGSPDYVRRGLYIPLGRDSEGRQRAVRLDDILPETAIFDSFNADGVAGTIPPAVQLAAQLVTGKGYQGRDLYRTGTGWAETQRLMPQEAARGVVSALWQFGAYPWMPGQPMTERLVKALADKSVPVDTITDKTAQAALKIMSGGPAAFFDAAAFSTDKKGAQAVPDVGDALARTLGVKSYPVTTTTSEPGTARSNQQGREADLLTLDRMMGQEMRSAQSDEQRREITERYARRQQPIIDRLRAP